MTSTQIVLAKPALLCGRTDLRISLNASRPRLAAQQSWHQSISTNGFGFGTLVRPMPRSIGYENPPPGRGGR